MDLSQRKTNLFCNLGVLKSGSKIYKLSTYNGQILVVAYDTTSENFNLRMCYNEDDAFEYLEDLLYDKNYKIGYR
jgi:hypothetical protein